MKKGLLIVLVLALIICTGCASKAVVSAQEPLSDNEPLYLLKGITMGMTMEQVKAHDPDSCPLSSQPFTLNSSAAILEDGAVVGLVFYYFNDNEELYKITISMVALDPSELVGEEQKTYHIEKQEEVIRLFQSKYGLESDIVERGRSKLRYWNIGDVQIEYEEDEYSIAYVTYTSIQYTPKAIGDTI